MRPIDADALMESIGCADAVKYGNRDRAQQDTSYSTMMLYEIRNEIDAQPTVGGWISVKDRLPNAEAVYLAVKEKKNGERDICLARFIPNYPHYDIDLRASVPGPYWVCGGNNNIIFWQPLPDLPEVDA